MTNKEQESDKEYEETFNWYDKSGEDIKIDSITIPIKELLKPRLIRLDVLARMAPGKKSIASKVRSYLKMAKENKVTVFKLQVGKGYPDEVNGYIFYADSSVLFDKSKIEENVQKITRNYKETGIVLNETLKANKTLYSWSSEIRSFQVGSRLKKLNNVASDLFVDYTKTRKVDLFKVVGEYIANAVLILKIDLKIDSVTLAQKKHVSIVKAEGLMEILVSIIGFYTKSYQITDRSMLSLLVCEEARTLGSDYSFFSSDELETNFSFIELADSLSSINCFYGEEEQIEQIETEEEQIKTEEEQIETEEEQIEQIETEEEQIETEEEQIETEEEQIETEEEQSETRKFRLKSITYGADGEIVDTDLSDETDYEF
jgi:hypothetical protein